MSNRHLYRAKRKDNGEWVEGIPFEIESKTMFLIKDDENFLRVHYLEENMWCADIYAIEVDPSTICQCTGVKDRNGRLIWENDILHRAYHSEDDCIAVWNDGRFCFKTIHGQYNQDPMTLLSVCFVQKTADRLAVIGNIFDNPELMEAGE